MFGKTCRNQFTHPICVFHKSSYGFILFLTKRPKNLLLIITFIGLGKTQIFLEISNKMCFCCRLRCWPETRHLNTISNCNDMIYLSNDKFQQQWFVSFVKCVNVNVFVSLFLQPAFCFCCAKKRLKAAYWKHKFIEYRLTIISESSSTKNHILWLSYVSLKEAADYSPDSFPWNGQKTKHCMRFVHRRDNLAALISDKIFLMQHVLEIFIFTTQSMTTWLLSFM